MAEDTAESVRGVIDVHNRLRLLQTDLIVPEAGEAL
jgi:hypothetical protein